MSSRTITSNALDPNRQFTEYSRNRISEVPNKNDRPIIPAEKRTLKTLSAISATHSMMLKTDNQAGMSISEVVCSPAQEVEAVVSGYVSEAVIFDCRAQDGTVEIKLPKSIVPEALLSFGTPVYISLGFTDGYRAPQVKPRKIDTIVDDPELLELHEWVGSL